MRQGIYNEDNISVIKALYRAGNISKTQMDGARVNLELNKDALTRFAYNFAWNLLATPWHDLNKSVINTYEQEKRKLYELLDKKAMTRADFDEGIKVLYLQHTKQLKNF